MNDPHLGHPGGSFNDRRLDRRFTTLLQQLTDGVGSPIPFACQDWANTTAAYRFISNPKVNEADILSGHFESTQDRVAATDGLVLILHDSTEFSYKREDIEAIGMTHEMSPGPRLFDGRTTKRTVCGILMHSSLGVTPQGLPLEISAIKFWTRKKFKGIRALSAKINPTRVPRRGRQDG